MNGVSITPKNHFVKSCPHIIGQMSNTPTNAILTNIRLSKARVGMSLKIFLIHKFFPLVSFFNFENKRASKFSVIIKDIQDAKVIRTVYPKKFSQYFLIK